MTLEKLLNILFVAIILVCVRKACSYNLTILTKNGYVEDYRIKSYSKPGKHYFSFKSIPYAEPPLGSLRFQEPKPISSWKGVMSFLHYVDSCTATKNIVGDIVLGSEDCLYVNIFVPDTNKSNSDLSLPVMVWIHGGAFIVGDSYIDPSLLLEKQVIVASLSYRLGVLGFLSTQDENAWGNVGLKDQSLALRWIKDNIEFFGGNPDKITIFGESAGGASIEYHLISPLSAGLFSQAIVQSGSTLNEWGFRKDPKELTMSFAKLFGITSNDTKKVVQELQKINYMDLVSKSQKVKPFVPSVEVAHEGAFVDDSSYNIWSSGTFNKVPVMIGHTTKDKIYGKDARFHLAYLFYQFDRKFMPSRITNLLMRVIVHLGTKERVLFLTEHFAETAMDHKRVIPAGLNIDANSPEADEVVKKIADQYFPNNSFDNVTKFHDFNTQHFFVRGIRRTIADLVKTSLPVYYYQFSYATTAKYTHGINEIADSGEESMYIFYGYLDTEADVLMQDRMVTMFTNFAIHGNPTPNLDPVLGVIWPEAKDGIKGEDDVRYLEIGKDLVPGMNPFQEDFLFWRELFKNYSRGTIYTY